MFYILFNLASQLRTTLYLQRLPRNSCLCMFANTLIEHGLVRNLASEVPGLSGSDLKRFPVAYGLTVPRQSL